jgi:hypothetical protein
MGFNPRKAMEQGIPVQDVLESWQKHLLDQRDELRRREAVDGPASAQKTVLAIKQDAAATGLVWEVLGDNAAREPIMVKASSWEAARNKVSVRELLEMRLHRVLVARLIGSGRYKDSLEDRRAAFAEVMGYELFIAEVGLVKS